MSDGNNDGGTPPAAARPIWAALVLAGVALAAFFLAVAVMWGKADDPDNETAWARWTFLLAGIEAIAFAAAGWVFGSEVHRAAAVQAQKDKEQAETEATQQRDRATEAVTSGRRLRDAIAAEAGAAAGSGRAADALGGGPVDGAPDPMQRLVALARNAFPD